MARVEMVTCDQCRKSEQEQMAMGWIRTSAVPAYAIHQFGANHIDRDFCSPACLVAFYAPVPQEVQRR